MFFSNMLSNLWQKCVFFVLVMGANLSLPFAETKGGDRQPIGKRDPLSTLPGHGPLLLSDGKSIFHQVCFYGLTKPIAP
jgi:hypothetical protein